MGFDDYATDNLWQLLTDQRQATGSVPTNEFTVERSPRRGRRLAHHLAFPGTACTCTPRGQWP